MWTVRLDQIDASTSDRYLGWLTSDEKQKHEKFATAALRKEWLVTRALSRWVLARYVPAVQPAEFRFERTPDGPPFVVLPSVAVRRVPRFNLSNSEGLVVCAVSRYPVGVDVELVSRDRSEAFSAMTAKTLSDEEKRELVDLPPESCPRRAALVWTVKEAYLKARGEGIAIHLDRLTVRPRPRRPGEWDIVDARASASQGEWQIAVHEVFAGDSPLDRAWTLAVAVRKGSGPNVPVVLHPPVVPE